MAKGGFVGVDNIARKVKSVHVGVGGVARNVVKGYVGVAGVARMWWEIEGERVVQISARDSHTLFLTSSGQVYSCGSNNYGQLGRAVANGSVSSVNLGLIDGLSGIVGIAAGANHTLFLTSSGQVYSCGSNNYGQLGRAVASGGVSSVNLGLIEGLSGIVGIAAGANHTLFLTSSGQVYSCGYNNYGQLGRAVANGSVSSVNLGLIEGLSGINKVRTGVNFSFFFDDSGQVYSCGQNTYGTLGRSVNTGSATIINLGLIEELSGITDIVGGASHTLILVSSGHVYSCGVNDYGQLGRAVANGSATAVNLGLIEGLSGVTRIAAGYYFSLAVADHGQIYNFGRNDHGQLARIVADGSPAVVNLGLMERIAGVTDICAGNNHSIYLRGFGEVYSSGRNGDGELGRLVFGGGSTTVNIGQIQFPFSA